MESCQSRSGSRAGLRIRKRLGSGRCGWVFEHQDDYPSQGKAIESMSEKLDINHETLRQWVRRAETDATLRRE